MGSLKDVDYRQIASVLLFYISLYGFLAGMYALMLRGVIAEGGETLLWAFLVVGIIFTLTVTFGVALSQRNQRREERNLDDVSKHVSKRYPKTKSTVNDDDTQQKFIPPSFSGHNLTMTSV